MTIGSHWGDQQVEQLITLWKEGMPATKIAQKMSEETGYKYTRNSVIGKVFRLGLSRNGERTEKIKQNGGQVQSRLITPRRKPETKIAAPSRRKRGSSKLRKAPMGEPDPSKQIILTKTLDFHCRAIVGYQDGEKGKAICCGEETIWVARNGRTVRTSWCSHHFKLFTTESRVHGRKY